MLKNYPPKFNGTEIPWPTKWEESSSVVEIVNETEAGTDQINVIRYDKLSVAAGFNVTSFWASRLKTYSRQGVISVHLFDVEENGYKERTMRIRDFSMNMVENSEKKKETNGLWEVSFNLEEF